MPMYFVANYYTMILHESHPEEKRNPASGVHARMERAGELPNGLELGFRFALRGGEQAVGDADGIVERAEDFGDLAIAFRCTRILARDENGMI